MQKLIAAALLCLTWGLSCTTLPSSPKGSAEITSDQINEIVKKHKDDLTELEKSVLRGAGTELKAGQKENDALKKKLDATQQKLTEASTQAGEAIGLKYLALFIIFAVVAFVAILLLFKFIL